MFSSLTAIAVTGILYIFVIAFYCFFKDTRMQRALPYPPGPKPSLLIGNLGEIPSERSWVTYKVWGKKYDSKSHIHHSASYASSHLFYQVTLFTQVLSESTLWLSIPCQSQMTSWKSVPTSILDLHTFRW